MYLERKGDPPSSLKSTKLDIEINLLGRLAYELNAVTPMSQIGRETGYEVCIENTGTNNFIIIAEEIGGGTNACELTLSRNGQTTETNC